MDSMTFSQFGYYQKSQLDDLTDYQLFFCHAEKTLNIIMKSICFSTPDLTGFIKEYRIHIIFKETMP